MHNTSKFWYIKYLDANFFYFSIYDRFIQIQPCACIVNFFFNPLPDRPILGSSNSKATKDMMSKILTNGDTII